MVAVVVYLTSSFAKYFVVVDSNPDPILSIVKFNCKLEYTNKRNLKKVM